MTRYRDPQNNSPTMPGKRAPATTETVQEEEQENRPHGHRSLHFNESLSWRAGKPIPLQTLLHRLQALARELRGFEQEDAEAEWFSDIAQQLAAKNFLAHKDSGVKALAARCLVDVLKLCAPDAPFSGAQLNVRISCRLPDQMIRER